MWPRSPRSAKTPGMSSCSREEVPASVHACGPHAGGTLEALTVLAPANSSLWLTEPFPVRLTVQLGLCCGVWRHLVLLCSVGISFIKGKGRLNLTCPCKELNLLSDSGQCVCPLFLLYQRSERDEASATRGQG